MAMEFRPLEQPETDRFRELIALFSEVFEEPHNYAAAVPDDVYLAEFLGDRRHIVMVAIESGRVIGGLVAYILDKFEQARREAYIYDLAVGAGHRRRGVATGLIKALKPIAKSRGCYVIFVQSEVGDEPATRLYQSLGTQEDAHHFDIPVDDEM